MEAYSADNPAQPNRVAAGITSLKAVKVRRYTNVIGNRGNTLLTGGITVGMDFTAYVGHSLNVNEIYKLCYQLNADSLVYIDQFVKYLYPYNQKDYVKKWVVIEDSLGGTIEIIGPCGMNFMFSEKVCYFHHYIRWINFLQNEELQLYLRKVTFDLTRYLRSSYAIYVPDNATKESSILDFIWDDENKDIEYIRNWLLLECGKPKENIVDIYTTNGHFWDSKGYYIDEFRDFCEITQEAPDIL